MNDKKLTVKRIIIFVLLSYGLSWIPAALRSLFGILQDDAGFMFFTNLMMFTPAAASLLTRYITKEGMKDSLLRINFKGNGRFYLLGILLPLIYSAAEAALYVIILKMDFAPGAILEAAGISYVGYTAAIFSNIAFAIALFPFFLGEELGWRGYLFPKLKTVMNRPAAYIVSGIIWGVWHAPAIIDGLNFGKNYAGYPFVGIMLMCLFCIGVGIIFTWLTEKTNSVYPAAFAHAVNNNVTGLVTGLTSVGAADERKMPIVFVVGTLGVFIVSIFCIIENVAAGRRKAN